MSNCGLKALERITELKEVSMFTLIHLAKDNGLNLYFCKVEPEELVQVARPAIFHQKDHFVFIENGEPMPGGEYDGYVLTQKPLHEPLPFSLAKKILGGKKGGGIISSIVTGIASVINPILGAVVGAGVGAHRATGGSGFEGDAKGEFWRIGTGALSGATAISHPAISAVSAAVGEVPGAIKSGNYLVPVTAGLTQYGANLAAPNIVSGVKNLASGISNVFGKTAPTGGVELAKSASIPTPKGYTGSVTLPGVGSTSVQAAQKLASGGDNFMSKIFTPEKIFQIAGAGASTLISPPKYEGLQPTQNFSKAAEYLGMENFQALPTATRNQLEKYTNKSLQELSQEFYAPDDKGIRTLEERKQREIDALTTQYANYGQDPYTSSEAQQRLTEVNRQYDQAIGEYQQQVQNQAMQEAIRFKQDILGKSMEQGNFDYESAMELATHMGLDEQYRFALETKNYDQLQELLSKIFEFGRS